MADKAVKQSAQDAKKQRLARALRENLKKRKAQSRQRVAGAGKTGEKE